jgi:molybdopterin converting factor small subunit
MKLDRLPLWLGVFLSFALLTCATTPPPVENRPLIPLRKANLTMVIKEEMGLEISLEDVKDARDYYRGGVQKKAKADKQFQAKNYKVALDLYDTSNEFFLYLLDYIPYDSLSYPLYEGSEILFFPHLLMADNDLKMGRIYQTMGREGSARRKWKQALTAVEKSLASERTEWGENVRKEILSALKAVGH